MKSKPTSTSGTTGAPSPIPAPNQVRQPAHGLTWQTCLLLFAAALGARAGWGAYLLVKSTDVTSLEFPDEEQYWSMGESLRAGEGLTDELGFRATRMPLYPAFLSVFAESSNGIVFAKAAHWVVGALAAALAGAFAATLGGKRIGLITGLLVALDPFLIFFSSLLLTETFFITALVGLWWTVWPLTRPEAASRDALRRWLAVGLIAALCIYLRPSSAGLVLAALGFVLVCRRFRLRACMGILVALSVVGLCLVPWAARNRQITGDRCWLTNRAGISLYDGVGPQATGDSDLGSIKSMPAVRGLDEAAWNSYFLSESFRTMREDPLRIARLGLVKVARTWNPLPNVRTYRSPLPLAISAVWTLSTFAFAVAGAIIMCATSGRGEWRVVVFLLLPALYFTALHSLFVGSVRYRLPALPMLGILAAFALAAVIRRIQERRERRRSSCG